MKKIKSLLTLAVLCFLVQSTSAQRLLVKYDFLNDDFTYYEIGKNGLKKEISRPVVTRNYNVKVEVENYNPFVYTAVANYSVTEFQNAPNMGF